jgi:hypothetical protein
MSMNAEGVYKNFKRRSHSDELVRSAAGAGGLTGMQQVVTGEVGLRILGSKQSVSGLAEYPEYWNCLVHRDQGNK